MKSKKIFIMFSFILLLLCLGSVSAMDENNNLTTDSSDVNLESTDELQLNANNVDENLGECDNSVVLSSNVIVVDEVEQNHNEMNSPTIQKAIDGASDGDTIIINGRSYVHCHFVVNKKLTIISNVGTTLDPCSSKATSNHQGIFYLTSKASGTVIQGFTFINDDLRITENEGYGILVKGASDVTIKDCDIATNDVADSIRLENTNGIVIDNVTVHNSINGINALASENLLVKNSQAYNCNYGINMIDVTKTSIDSNDISKNKIAGISFSGKGSELTVKYNNLCENGNGINITSANNVYILSNYISFNKNNGVYIDYEITLVEIKGNFFNQNLKWEIFNDFHVQNSAFATKGPKLQMITNNYMVNYGGFGSGDVDRPVWTQVYEYRPGSGDYSYDADKDIYSYVGSGGDYYGHQGIMFLGHVFEINEYVFCPNIYSAPKKIWSSAEPSLELKLSEITQVKKGIYSISIVDANGNVAKDISSVPVTFYINKVGKTAAPQEGDVYKTVMMKNGTATVRFYADEFSKTGNVITAVFPTPGSNFDDKVSKTLSVSVENIPGIPSNTTIAVSDVNTYPNSNHVFIATLTDASGNPLKSEALTFNINSKNYNILTDDNGKAQIVIDEAKEGTYTITVSYAGDGDIDYYGSYSKARVVVKKTSSKIVSSNLNMVPKMAEYYSVTLKDALGNALANQKVTIKVNGKTYTKITDSKGVAKVKLKFNKNKKTYKVIISYKGNNKYNAVIKTNKIIVKYSSKKAKLSTPNLVIPPKTAKYYTVSLKDENAKGISKQKVVVKINGKKYTKKTNSKGQIKIKVKFSKLKIYKVKATYKGSKIYKKASSNGKIIVAKTATKITAPTVSLLPKESKTYTVTLKAGSKALSKQKLTIKVNGKTYTKTTDSKGQASVGVNFATENAYNVDVNYKGTGTYKASKATGKIIVSKLSTQITSYDKTFARDAQKNYQVTLKDTSGNSLASKSIVFDVNGSTYTKTTDSQGNAVIGLDGLTDGTYDVIVRFTGNDQYKESSSTNKITVSPKSGIVFVDDNLPNDEIQNILNHASNGSDIEFLGDRYSDISLNINKALNIYSSNATDLIAKAKGPVFRITGDNVNITGFSIKGNSGDAIVIDSANNVNIENNIISNVLDSSKLAQYAAGTVNMPGYGISVTKAANVKLSKNNVKSFESAIFAQESSNIVIGNNTLKENNYGIKYGFGVANTEIANNTIFNQTGLYIMTVPEGPSGYGIFLNNSAVNVTINHNHIYANHLGISLDANYSTGIVITQNTITDNVLEGMRFNAGYDLAENAVAPHVTDNAIYRNARGPSMMILGELSANPFGIYGGGLTDPSQKLQLEANWYGTNNLVTWDNDTGVVGYGTMCPRINTTNIEFNMTFNSPGNYSIIFYKNGVFDSNLPVFDMYATLNNAVEVNFNVVDGVGTFTFNSSDYSVENNKIDISIGSLINSTSRTFKVTYGYTVPNSEIPD